MQILFFLLETVFFLLIGAALLRAWMNHLRIHMAAQPGRFVMAITDWLVQPVRRVLPKPMAQGRVDWGSLMSAVLLAFAYGGLWLGLAVSSVPAEASPLTSMLAIVVVGLRLLARVALQGLMVILLVYAVMSWVQPQSPLMSTLHRLCDPIVRPIRRFVPQIGGVDLSVLFLIVLLQVGLMLLA
ncbi:YggT family protein [Hydrogenophaga bisanensis]|uniref:YggT family protein n=1 Tax=Hydrogenophaga bisanensis TaxID=439611 RepID=A0ABW2R8K9_9BURK|nr:YggT family protein [Betaproteobacteria bacterium]